MHQAAMDFIARVRQEHPYLFRSVRVLECGARNINGSARAFFSDCDYVGLDASPGPGVDVVSLVHEYEPEHPFDVIISLEMLEHDPHWRDSISAMVRMLAPGGALILTWASPLRERHEVECAPDGMHYAGLELSEVVRELQACGWHRLEAHVARNGLDCQLLAMRPVISVVVGAVGQPLLTNCCIQEVLRLATAPTEVIVVSNGSTPRENEIFRRVPADVLITASEALGFPRTYNLGASRARGRYLMLLNNDAWPTRRGWDTRMIDILQNVPRAGLVAASCPRVSNSLQRRWEATPGSEPIAEVDYASFVAVMLRRSVWHEVGELDERFGVGNYEDDDYCVRLRLAGYKVLIDPATVFFHVGSVTMHTTDYASLLAANKRLFEQKWSAHYAEANTVGQ